MAVASKKSSATTSRKAVSKTADKASPTKVSKKAVVKKTKTVAKPLKSRTVRAIRKKIVAEKAAKVASVEIKNNHVEQVKKEAYIATAAHQHARVLSNPRNLVANCELNFASLIDGAAIICSKRFLPFLEINLYLTIGFLLTSLISLWVFGSSIHYYFADFVSGSKIFNILGIESATYVAIFLLFWIFFCWLRASYLVAINNYFASENHQELALQTGFKRTVSFMLAEFMQVVTFILGALMGIVMMPVFMTQYLLSLPAMISQKEMAINSLFESKEYVKGQFFKTLGCAVSITLFIGAAMASCLLITDAFFSDKLILFSINFFLFSFLFLPLHASYRFLLYKKLQSITGQMRFRSTLKERIWFVFSRITLLAAIIVDVFLFAK